MPTPMMVTIREDLVEVLLPVTKPSKAASPTRLQGDEDEAATGDKHNGNNKHSVTTSASLAGRSIFMDVDDALGDAVVDTIATNETAEKASKETVVVESDDSCGKQAKHQSGSKRVREASHTKTSLLQTHDSTKLASKPRAKTALFVRKNAKMAPPDVTNQPTIELKEESSMTSPPRRPHLSPSKVTPPSSKRAMSFSKSAQKKRSPIKPVAQTKLGNFFKVLSPQSSTPSAASAVSAKNTTTTTKAKASPKQNHKQEKQKQNEPTAKPAQNEQASFDSDPLKAAMLVFDVEMVAPNGSLQKMDTTDSSASVSMRRTQTNQRTATTAQPSSSGDSKNNSLVDEVEEPPAADSEAAPADVKMEESVAISTDNQGDGAERAPSATKRKVDEVSQEGFPAMATPSVAKEPPVASSPTTTAATSSVAASETTEDMNTEKGTAKPTSHDPTQTRTLCPRRKRRTTVDKLDALHEVAAKVAMANKKPASENKKKKTENPKKAATQSADSSKSKAATSSASDATTSKKTRPAKSPAAKEPKSPVKSAAKSKKSAADTSKSIVLSKECRSRLEDYQSMIQKHTADANALIDLTCDRGFDGEGYDVMDSVTAVDIDIDGASAGDDDRFPLEVIPNMLVLIEGSSDPLSVLSQSLKQNLEKAHSCTWTLNEISKQIESNAERKSFAAGWDPPSTTATAAAATATAESTVSNTTSSAATNSLGDNVASRLWRWEVTTSTLLPKNVRSNAFNARMSRKKVHGFLTALRRAVTALDTMIKKIQDTNTTPPFFVERINQAEKKVADARRELEKQRKESKMKLIKWKMDEEKKQQRALAIAEKKKEKDRKKAEADRKKQAAAQEREEMKKREETEREEKQQKAKSLLSKQKATFMSFFGGSSTPQKQTAEATSSSSTSTTRAVLAQSTSKKGGSQPSSQPSSSSLVSPSSSSRIATKQAATEANANTFDVDAFRAQIQSQDEPPDISNEFHKTKLSKAAKRSRRRRTRRIKIHAYVTNFPDAEHGGAAASVNPFDTSQQPFAELTEVEVHNRYRFLRFHLDYRPPYFGTWSKPSKVINGRNPFGKDSSLFNYDYDSEAEWVAGDNEIGEDVQDDSKNVEEEEVEDEKQSNYIYDDGFCVADEEYVAANESFDEETRMLYEQKVQSSQNTQNDGRLRLQTVSVIAPLAGGIPFNTAAAAAVPSEASRDDGNLTWIEGMQASHANDLIMQHECDCKSDAQLCLDAYPPALLPEPDDEDETAAGADGGTTNGGTGSASTKNVDEYTLEDLKTMARLFHHSTALSKEKLIEELRNLDPITFLIKAKAARKLDSIAEKHRRVGGVFWVVKNDVLKELGLEDLLTKEHGFQLPSKKTPGSAKKNPSSTTPKAASSSSSAAAPGETDVSNRNSKIKPSTPNTWKPSAKATTKASTPTNNVQMKVQKKKKRRVELQSTIAVLLPCAKKAKKAVSNGAESAKLANAITINANPKTPAQSKANDDDLSKHDIGNASNDSSVSMDVETSSPQSPGDASDEVTESGMATAKSQKKRATTTLISQFLIKK